MKNIWIEKNIATKKKLALALAELVRQRVLAEVRKIIEEAEKEYRFGTK